MMICFAPKPLCRYHTAQSYRAVTYNRSDFTRRDLRGESCVVTYAHHIRKSK
jgi:hypothetical protein